MPIMGRKAIGTIAYMGGVIALPQEFCWAWGQMIQYNTEYLCEPGETIHYDRATVSYHAFARNSLVERVRGDWLLMLDTDHVFDPDIASRMAYQMNRHEIDVLSGIYQYKSHPHSPVLYEWNEKADGLIAVGDWSQDARIFEIGSAGGGCLMIRRKVFERIKKELKEGPFDIIPPYSEDHSFFVRLKKLELKAYCDPHIECHHLSMKALSLSDYDKSEVSLNAPIPVEGRI